MILSNSKCHRKYVPFLTTPLGTNYDTRMVKTRIEKDSMGELPIPADAYYGVQTQRAVINFPISGWRAHPDLILATVQIKRAAMIANMKLNQVDKKKGKAVLQACEEMLTGKLHDNVVVDVFQAGAGTSFHMNINEILANRAIEILGGKRGDYKVVSPNDDVNFGQSTNDVIPTALRISILLAGLRTLPVLEKLRDALAEKGKEFDGIIKSGRTHLQDAVPVRLGQEFHAYATIVDQHTTRYRRVLEDLKVLGIGGTATGTGLNAHPKYRRLVAEELSKALKLKFSIAQDLFAAMQSMAPIVAMSGVLRNLALDLIKISNDFRLLSSGPRTGLREIELPACQPGSSIMPGKVNPVMPEMLMMICFQVLGNDQAISFCSQAGQLELNVTMPLIIFNIVTSLRIFESGLRIFTEKCVRGITANEDRCHHFAERSTSLVTALNPYIGYLKAAEIAKEVMNSHKSIREIVLEKQLMSEAELNKALDLDAMTRASENGS
jgi:aspartate ammonia-lyase